MAISAAMRNDIIELAVITNNAAPGTTLLAELVALADAGKTLAQIADTLVARSAFTATYPSHQTSTEFGEEWIGNLLPEASAALQAECVIIVEGHINGGGSIASLMVDVQAFMSTDTSTNLATHIANFNNKVAVATYHTITKEAAAEWAIPSTVTSAAATVVTGKAAVDTALAPAAAVVAPVATFAVASDVSTVSEGGDVVFTLTTTEVAAGTEYSYVISGINSSDLSAGSLTGLAEVDADGKATVTVGLKNDTTTEGTETMVMTVAGKTASVSVTDSSTTAAAVAAATATFAVASDVSTVSEGGDVVFTLTTTNVSAGTEYSYVISGVNSADLSSGSLTGLAEVDADGKATVTVGLNNDTTTEGAETMVMTVAGETASVSVTDSSTTPAAATVAVATYSLAAGATSVDEGTPVNFTLTTTNVDSGSIVAYTVSGVSSADIDGGALVGTTTVGVDGKAVIAVTPKADTLTEGAETLTVTAATATASTTVNDTSLTPAIVGSTYALTTSPDSFTGNSGDDTFNATDATWTTGDSIDGVSGDDTFTITSSSAITDPVSASVLNIDTGTIVGSSTVRCRCFGMDRADCFNINSCRGYSPNGGGYNRCHCY